jgi:hypothetical protein
MALFVPDVMLSLYAVVGSSGARFFTWVVVVVLSVFVGSDEMRLSLSSAASRLSTARCALVLLLVPSRFSCTSWVLFEGFLVVALCDADGDADGDADADGSLVRSVVLNGLVLLDRSTVRVFVLLDFLEGRHLLQGAAFFLAVTNSRVLRRVFLRLGELLRLAVVSSARGEGLFVFVFVSVLVLVLKAGVMIEGVVREESGEDSSSSWAVLVRVVATTSVGIGSLGGDDDSCGSWWLSNDGSLALNISSFSESSE